MDLFHKRRLIDDRYIESNLIIEKKNREQKEGQGLLIIR